MPGKRILLRACIGISMRRKDSGSTNNDPLLRIPWPTTFPHIPYTKTLPYGVRYVSPLLVKRIKKVLLWLKSTDGTFFIFLSSMCTHKNKRCQDAFYCYVTRRIG